MLRTRTGGFAMRSPLVTAVRRRTACATSAFLAAAAFAVPAGALAATDTTPPDTTIVSAPSQFTQLTDAELRFTSTESGSSFECTLNGSAWAACSAPKLYAALAENAYVFDVRAIDAAGNIDPTPARHKWTVDTTLPDTTIDLAPGPVVSSSSATFHFSSEAESAAFCRLDAGAWKSCGSPKTYGMLGDENGPLAEGSHTFHVYTVDAAGNLEPAPATHTWIVNTTPPDTSITGGPSAGGLTTAAGATFDFASSEPGGATFQCRLDGDAGAPEAGWAPCASPKSLAALADGQHTFGVRALDVAGSVDPTPVSVTWTVDAAAPSTTLNVLDVRAGSSATFTFGASEPGAFQCRLAPGPITDATPWVGCTSGQPYHNLTDGPYAFEVRAVDVVGNVDPTPAHFTWIADTGPPETTLSGGPSGTTNASGATFELASNERSSTFECSIDGRAFAPCAAPLVLGGLADGAHSVAVRALDASGQPDPSPAARSWTVDTGPPLAAAGPGAPGVGGAKPSPTTISDPILISDPATPALAFARVSRGRLLRDGTIVLRVRCTAACTVRISGKVSLSDAGLATTSASFGLKSARHRLAAGKTVQVRISLSKRARALVRRAFAGGQTVQATVRIAVSDATGRAGSATRAFTLSPPSRR